ncbi:phosphate ABC transporter permease subunit PstC [Frigidibacter sp. MR17.14]|uniref:phosphate ABC transporter permease subunit PstC n=1 Tax=Frigidibacter sp. MR17.14 TaxID=3126509 RepID=UPI003012A6F6
MPATWILALLAALAVVGFVIGRARALASAGGDGRRLHSLPGFYGWHVAMFTFALPLLLLVVWMIVQPLYLREVVAPYLPASALETSAGTTIALQQLGGVAAQITAAEAEGKLDAAEIRALASQPEALAERLTAAGITVADPQTAVAAEEFQSRQRVLDIAKTAAVLALAVALLAWTVARTNRDFRARNTVETGVRYLLIGASVIAIFTTIGIVLSMLFETAHFFKQYDWTRFFFGTVWTPRFQGESDLGLLPLLWGTLYVSAIALAVAVPIGLFAAIYMSEYAGPKLRSVAKPLIELLAGIPTIVYGLFALVTVGPLLRDWIAQPMGLGSSGSSVMTAGLVMGIMIIPFVSSLSDDIINAVPQSLRDGSYGLGATQSETIKKVVLPAALPGIVGAILLAASRAIGETMIVVLGAGAAARLSLNPFEAMTTVTVKIVSQLTGDTNFGTPETLVAFALGLTLFVMTLILNIVALIIVRKYREQYE